LTIAGLPPELLGERLRTARSNAGLTQDAAADAMGMARTTLVAIEKGQRRVRSDEFSAFAKLYVESARHLLSPAAKHVEFKPRYRRPEAGAKPSQVRSSDDAVRLLSKLATGAAELEAALASPLKRDYPPPVQIRPGQLLIQAEDAATAMRQRLGIGLSPITDIVSLVELDLGVRVFVRPMAGSVSGVYAYDAEVGACILVNARRPRVHRMNTIAHETGHFASDRTVTDVYEDDELPTSVEERFANSFASAFLMPAAGIRARFSELSSNGENFSPRQLILLAHMYGVSTQAACLRLERLSLLPAETWASIKDRGFTSDYERRVLGDAPPDVSGPIVPPRLAYLAASALEREVLSEGELSELLVVDRQELRDIVAPFAGEA
jgi:Zn-dependent peptidase ImmA (M78 family)/transcriptional regulator with XRE-family HTH domain